MAEKLINITAPQYRCEVGASCPAVYKSEDGKTFVVVGKYATLPEDADVGDDEGVVDIPADLLLSSLGLPALIEAAEPFAALLCSDEDGFNRTRPFSFEDYDAKVRALREALSSIKGGK